MWKKGVPSYCTPEAYNNYSKLRQWTKIHMKIFEKLKTKGTVKLQLDLRLVSLELMQLS